MFIVLLLAIPLSFHATEGNMENFMPGDMDTTCNWTTCEEFLNNTSFDVDSVIDVDWKIFFFGVEHQRKYTNKSCIMRLSRPSPMLVDRFRLELNNDIQPAVNYSHSELYLETSFDLSGLFIKTNVSGQFRLIPCFSEHGTSERNSDFRFHLPTPLLLFAMKVIDGYLALMNCKQQLVFVMAPVENVPNPLNIEEIVARFGIQTPITLSNIEKYHDDNMDPDDFATVELSKGLMF